jgi:potassium/chloride transporter 9
VPGLTGLSSTNLKNNMWSDYKTTDFAMVLALFFNACTCILAGSNSSTHLKNPTHSIPKGTVIAHLSTTGLYFLFIMLIASCGTRAALLNSKYIIAAEIAWPTKWIVFIGILASSIGAAMQ